MRQVNQNFQQALKYFQQGNFVKSKKIAEKILKKHKNNPVVFHLLALINKQENNLEKSKHYFKQSLKYDSSQAPVLSNYANLLIDLNAKEKADKYYAKATQSDSQLVDAWYNWANLLNTEEKFQSALQKIDCAIAIHSNNSSYYCTRGVAYTGLERFSDALTAFEHGMKLAKGHSSEVVNLIQNKALTLRAMHKPHEAVESLQDLIESNIKTSNVYFIKACAHYDIDEYEQAESELLKALDLQPENTQAHEALNKLYWESANDSEFLKSYQKALEKLPNSEALANSFISQLIQAEKYEQADEQLNLAIKQCGKKPSLLYAKNQIHAKNGNMSEALKCLEQILKLDVNNLRVRIDIANFHIKNGAYKQALSQLDLAGKIDSLNQEVWATKGTCWRLLGDARAEWLNDYKRFISAQVISTPIGYDSLEHFFMKLKAALYGQHKTNRQPLDQSVQNGTQTVGNLLTIPDKVIQDYRVVLTKRIKNYLDNLPREIDHPFLNRITQEFRHSGAWSVKLQSGGFHSNHMHPQGWLSNCTYVKVPKDINKADIQRKGWIKFGETCLNLGERENIAKYVCPEEGVSVLFPSYFWHGTVPFESEEFRITLPSDIMPVA